MNLLNKRLLIIGGIVLGFIAFFGSGIIAKVLAVGASSCPFACFSCYWVDIWVDDPGAYPPSGYWDLQERCVCNCNDPGNIDPTATEPPVPTDPPTPPPTPTPTPNPCDGNFNCGVCGNPACAPGDPCAGNTNCGECGNPACGGSSSSSGGCTPSCSSPYCGQADGCGGGCSASDNGWNYSACSYGTFDRTLSNVCSPGTTSSQSCFGTISGYFFDASAYSSCPSDFSAAPIMENGTIEAASSTIAYTATTDAAGYYSIVARSPDTYNLTVLPSEPGTTYMTTPKFICDGATVAFTGVADTATRNYGFWRVYGGWFNSLGGGMYGGTGLTQSIPPSSPVQALIDEAAGTGEAGIPYVRTGTINLGTSLTASISASGFNATGTGFTGDRADYTYFLAKMGIYDKVVWDGTGKPTYSPGGNDFVIYTKNSNSSIGFAPSAGQKMIFLINGDVTIGADITIPVYANNPAFMAVIASGTITFKNNVSRADGWFVGKRIVFETLNDKINEKQFVGEGSFIGWDAISMQRDRGETNNSEPSETFVYRPDFMVNAPAPMTASYYVWRQENP